MQAFPQPRRRSRRRIPLGAAAVLAFLVTFTLQAAYDSATRSGSGPSSPMYSPDAAGADDPQTDAGPDLPASAAASRYWAGKRQQLGTPGTHGSRSVLCPWWRASRRVGSAGPDPRRTMNKLEHRYLTGAMNKFAHTLSAVYRAGVMKQRRRGTRGKIPDPSEEGPGTETVGSGERV